MAITLSKFILKKSSVAGSAPSPGVLDYGELAINYNDGKIFYKNTEGLIKSITGLGDNLAINAIIDAPKDGLVNDFDVRTIKLTGADGNDLYDGDYERLDTTLQNGNVDVRFSFNTFEIFKENDKWVIKSSSPESFDPYYELHQADDVEYGYPWDVPTWVSVDDDTGTLAFDLEIISNKGTPGEFGQYAIQASVGGLRLFGDVDQSVVPKAILEYIGEYNGGPSYGTKDSGLVGAVNTDFRGDFHQVYLKSEAESGGKYWQAVKGNVSDVGVVTYEDDYNEIWKTQNVDDGRTAYDPSLEWDRVGQPYNFEVEPIYSDAIIYQQISDIASLAKWINIPSQKLFEDTLATEIDVETQRALTAEDALNSDIETLEDNLELRSLKGKTLNGLPFLSNVSVIGGTTPNLSTLKFHVIEDSEIGLPQWSSTGESVSDIQDGWLIFAYGDSNVYQITPVVSGVIQTFGRWFASAPSNPEHPDEVTSWIGLGTSGTPVVRRELSTDTLEYGQFGVYGDKTYIGKLSGAVEVGDKNHEALTPKISPNESQGLTVSNFIDNTDSLLYYGDENSRPAYSTDGNSTQGATPWYKVYYNAFSSKWVIEGVQDESNIIEITSSVSGATPQASTWPNNIVFNDAGPITPSFVGQWCRVGDDEPYDWYQADTFTSWVSRFKDTAQVSTPPSYTGSPAETAPQQISIVLVASGNEFRLDTDFGKLLSIDGSTSYLYLPQGDANDVGKRLWVTSANASFLYDYSDIEYYGQTTPGVLYMAVATSFVSGSLRWKVSLDQTNVNLTGTQTIGGAKTFSSAPRSSGALSGNTNEIPNISQIYAMLVDPDNIIIREEMLSLANWSDASSGTGFINIGGRAQRNSGSFQINSGATLGGRGVAAFGGSNFWPQQHNPWRAVFCFTLDTLANVRIRVGFSLNPAALWTSRFTGLSYNSSLSPNLRFVNDSGSSPVFTDTGVAAAVGAFKLTMRGSTDGQIYISINDGAETLITGGLTFGVRSIFGIENLASGSARFEADFFSYFGTINR